MHFKMNGIQEYKKQKKCLINNKFNNKNQMKFFNKKKKLKGM